MKAGNLLLAAALGSGLVSAQPNPVIQTESRAVLVDALVTAKNGSYVRDLTAKDFRVWEDNREQTIKSFALESASTASQPRALVLFFDETSMEIHDQVLVRQAAARFIDAETGPNHRMAVVIYNGGLRVGQSFTDNAGRLKDALPSPESNVGQQENSPARRQQSGAPVNSAGGELGARNLLRSLRDLGSSLAVLPGRKILVLFSGTVAGSPAQRAEVRDVIDTYNRAGVAIYPVDVRPVFAQSDINPTPPALPADRARISGGGRLPPGQPHGDTVDDLSVAGNTGAGSQQFLDGLAGETGGFLVRNSNDLLSELQRIAAEQEEYYVVTYTPAESKEGACHTLRVKVDRGGTAVRARRSYCTSKPQDLLTGTAAGKDLERRAIGTEPGTLAASMMLPYVYVAPNRAQVHLAMEIAPGAVKFENQKGKLHAEINLLGIVTTANGDVRARFSDILNLNFENAAQLESLKARPIHYEKQFPIAPGEYKFTLTIGQGANFGKLESTLAVDPWQGTELALSSVILSRETRAAPADLGLGLGLADRDPFVTEGTEIVPVGSNRFSRSEPALFYFEVYGGDAQSVRVRVRVLNRQTQIAQWDSGLMKLPAANDPNNSSKLSGASTFPISSFAAGSYQLEVTAERPSGKPVARSVALEIQ
ncbi:MAG TPA: VWA domain-containing protein [Bryobacteraceae bacterium]|jgi:VWFA-related protein